MATGVLSGLPVWDGLQAWLDLQGVPSWLLVALALTLAAYALLVAFGCLSVIRMVTRLRRASREGKRRSRLTPGQHPLTTFRRDGVTADTINVRIVGTDGQLGAAFAAAGWYRADEITFVTALRISLDAALGRTYTTAPVSNLFLYGRRQDYAFEQPGRNVRERDHVRLWDSGARDADGRPIWVGAATKDVDVKISPTTHLPTHRIAPDVDTERDFMLQDLAATGWVLEHTYAVGFGKPTLSYNSDQDPFYTDGRIVELVLADVPILLPFVATSVRGRTAARLAKQVAAPLLRWRLPRARRVQGAATGTEEPESTPVAPRDRKARR